MSVALAVEIKFTSHEKYNALIDGLFEYHLNKNNAPIPRWMRENRKVLSEPWNLAEGLIRDERVAPNTPAEFYDRNVYIHWRDLLSV